MAHSRNHQSVRNRAASARRFPRPTQRGRILMATLALLAVAQTAAVWKRSVHGGNREDEITAGHDLSAVSLQLADGTLAGLADGRGRLLLVFDPDCAHSRNVAAMWRDWLSAGDPGRDRVLALSSASLPSATAYAREQRWRVGVASIAGEGGGNGLHSLTRRAPWVFAVSGGGRVLATGHGRKLAEVARAAGSALAADTR